MLQIAKNNGCYTILGSYIVDSNPELIAKNIGADFCIVGEAEYSFSKLVDALEKGLSISDIGGVIDARSGDYQYSPAVFTKNLDELPFVDTELTHMDEAIKTYHCLPLTLSRGCPYKCTFCYHLSGAHYRAKSIDYIFRELDYFIDKLGSDIHSLFIMDDCFNVDKNKVYEFCKRIKKYNLPFRIQTRIEYMDEETVIMLKDAGCIRIAYGIESASNKVLKSMRKNLTVEKTVEVLDITKKHGIIPDGLLIIGDVADDLETLKLTENFYLQNRDKYQLSMDMISLYPSSPLYKYAVDKNYIKDEIEFIEKGCPLVNISKIPDDIYDLLPYKFDKYYEADKINHAPLTGKSYKLEVTKQGLINVDGVCTWCYKKIELKDFEAKIGEYIANQDYCPHCNNDIHWFYSCVFEKLRTSRLHYSEKVEQIFEKYSTKRIVIWGMSPTVSALLMCSQNLRNSVVCLVDINFKDFKNHTYCDLKVSDPSVLVNTDFDCLFVGTFSKREEVIEAANKLELTFELIEIAAHEGYYL